MVQGISGFLPEISNNGYKFRLHYDQQYDIEANQSTITIYAEGYYDSYAPTTPDGVITVNGNVIKTYNLYNAAGGIAPNKSWEKLPGSGSYTVDHNQDGTGSISVGIAGYNFGVFVFVNNSYSYTNANFGIKTWSLTLGTIPRASQISASGISLGTNCDVSWTPNSTSFAYKIRFAMGDWSGVTPTITPGATTEFKYSGYQIPLSVATQIPNAATGIMTATLYTYADADCVTQIGQENSTTFTVSVPDTIIPSITSISASIINDNEVINGWDVAVAGYTKVRIQAEASGVYGSTILSFSISGGYSQVKTGTSLDYIGSIISSSGTKEFVVSCTDSRGRVSVASASQTFLFYDYSAPVIQSFKAERSDSDNSQIIVHPQWIFSSVNSKNSSTGVIQYKSRSSSAWTIFGTVSNGDSTLLSIQFDPLQSYNIRLIVTDYIGNSAQLECFIPTMDVLLDFRAGGKGLGIGKICESDSLEISLPMKLFNTISMDNHSIENMADPEKDQDAATKAYVDSKRFTATATIGTDWSSSAPYTQTISVPGVLASDAPHITPVYSSNFDTAVAQKEAWAMICEADAGNGEITFTCFVYTPTTGIPIQIEVIR